MDPIAPNPDLSCVLLAAGAASRFGGGKLTAMLDGAFLGVHAARTLAGFQFGQSVAVCNPDDRALCDAYASLGFAIVHNDKPERGQSESLRLGITSLSMRQPAGIMIALADMPFVSADHINSLIKTFRSQHELQAVTSFNRTTRLPPVILPRELYNTIGALSGDIGARNFLKDAAQVSGDQYMLADIDRPEDLSDAQTRSLPKSGRL